jgi:hypothetical protein
MLKKNSLPAGILVALVFPAIAIVVAYLLRNNSGVITRPALPHLTAVALNLILLRIAYKKGADKAVRGIMLATFLVMVLVFTFVTHIMT